MCFNIDFRLVLKHTKSKVLRSLFSSYNILSKECWVLFDVVHACSFISLFLRSVTVNRLQNHHLMQVCIFKNIYRIVHFKYWRLKLIVVHQFSVVLNLGLPSFSNMLYLPFLTPMAGRAIYTIKIHSSCYCHKYCERGKLESHNWYMRGTWQ